MQLGTEISKMTRKLFTGFSVRSTPYAMMQATRCCSTSSSKSTAQ